MKLFVFFLLLMSLGTSDGHAVIFPVVELSPETAGEEGFEIRVVSKEDRDGIRISIGFVKVPAYLEERCAAELRVREGNTVSLEAALQPVTSFRGTMIAYSFKIPRDLLPRAELYLFEGKENSSGRGVIVPLAKSVEVQ